MASFHYSAKAGENLVEGQIEVANFAEALSWLQSHGLEVLGIEEMTRSAQSSPQGAQAGGNLPARGNLFELQKRVDQILSEYGSKLSSHVRQDLSQARLAISLLRENFGLIKWWRLKKQLRIALQNAFSEIWKEPQAPFSSPSPQKPTSAIPKKRELPMWIVGFVSRIKMLDRPDQNSEEQLLKKEFYETVWKEIYRLSGLLFAFYIILYFVSYYFKRNGFDNNVLVRIFDAELFKQIVMGLFSLFAVLTIRFLFASSLVVRDAFLVLLWIASVWLIVLS